MDGRFHYPLIGASEEFLLYSPLALGNMSVATSNVLLPPGFSADRGDMDPLLARSARAYPVNSSRTGDYEQSPMAGLYWNAAELGGGAPTGTL